MTPRTEAGKRLLEDWQTAVRITKADKRLAIDAIEAEAAAREPAGAGLDVTMNDSRVVTGGLPDPSELAREPAGAGLRTPSDALRPFLRHEPWCNCKTDDDPDTQRCKCGLRAALAAPPAEPGLGRLRRIEAAAFSLVSTFSVLPVPILTEHDHAALRALRAALSEPKP